MARGPYYTPGKYWAKIISQALGQTKTGKPQFVLRFQVVGKVDPADPEGQLLSCGEQYERNIYMVITDKTIDFVSRNLDKLGFRKESFRFLDPATDGFADFTGQELAVECSHDTYEGNVGEKWRIAGDGGGLVVTPLDSKGVRELDALYGKSLKTATKAANSPTTSSKTNGAKNAARANQELVEEANEYQQTGNEVPF
jgi:hypothetical protein